MEEDRRKRRTAQNTFDEITLQRVKKYKSPKNTRGAVRRVARWGPRLTQALSAKSLG